MDVRTYFTSVRKIHHLANLRVQNFFDVEKTALEAAKKVELLLQIFLPNLLRVL